MANINCPIGLFPKQEAEIIRLTRAINRAPTAEMKSPWAQDLISAVDVLLTCQSFNEKSLDCRLCRNFSVLRRKTADLVVKASRLSR